MEYWFITWPDRSLTVAARIEAHSEPRPLGSAPWPFGPPKPMKTDLLCGAGFQPADRISSGPPAEGRRMRLQRSGFPQIGIVRSVLVGRRLRLPTGPSPRVNPALIPNWDCSSDSVSPGNPAAAPALLPKTLPGPKARTTNES